MSFTLKKWDAEEEWKQKIEKLATEIDFVLNGDDLGPDKKIGFLLITFPFGTSSMKVSNVSNGINDEDLLTLLQANAEQVMQRIAAKKSN